MMRILLQILLFGNIAFANTFVFNDDSLFMPKSVELVESISTELVGKTGVNMYIYMSEKLKSPTYQEFKAHFSSMLKSPFVAIVLIKNDKKIDIIQSEPNIVDKNKIYWEYMVPLLPKKDDELTSQALSAVVLNGYVESVDLIAHNFGVKIEHNIAKDEKGAKTIARVILYIMLFSMLGIVAIIYFFRNKK